MGNGKITKELKGLGLKMNNKEPNGETASEVIKGITDDYTGGSGATYTAGNGIGITDENVINADIKVLEVANITGLTTEQCESLNVGDVVVKLTSNQKHSYTVSYKEAGVGMCLTYVDASVSETVSYDCVEGNWVYNSTDVTQLGSGTKYRHIIDCNSNDPTLCYQGKFRIEIINNSATEFTFNTLFSYIEEISSQFDMPCLATINNDLYLDSCMTMTHGINPEYKDIACNDSGLKLTDEYSIEIYDTVIPM